MEKTNWQLALTQLFKCEDWIVKFLILFALIFLPIIGWLAILGYFLTITRYWYEGNTEELPEFSDFWDLVKLGWNGFLLQLIIGLTVIPFIIVVCIGWILLIPYAVILWMLMPYFNGQIALGVGIGDIIKIDSAKAFLKDNLNNLIIFVLVTLCIGIASNILTQPLSYIANASFQNSNNPIPFIVLQSIVAIISIITGMYSAYVSYALCGDILRIAVGDDNIDGEPSSNDKPLPLLTSQNAAPTNGDYTKFGS